MVASSNNNRENESAMYATTKIVCVSQDILYPTLNQYGEQPVLSMDSRRITEIGQQTDDRQYPAILFANASSGTWTLVEKHNESSYCVIAVGNSLKPYR